MGPNIDIHVLGVDEEFPEQSSPVQTNLGMKRVMINTKSSLKQDGNVVNANVSRFSS